MLLIFSENTHRLFHQKIKKELQLLILFKKLQMNLIAEQAKYWQIKAVNCKFHNRSLKSRLEKNPEMYSTHNEGKSVVPERFIRMLKNKIYKI